MKLEFTKEQIEVIRDMLVKEASRLRYKLSVLYNLEDKLSDAFYGKEATEDRDVDEGEAFYSKDLTRDSNDDSEEV